MHSIDASILVNAPVKSCYEQWMQFERFPEFMSHVISVQRVSPSELTIADELEDGGLNNPAFTGASQSATLQDPEKNYTGTIRSEILQEIERHGNLIWRWQVRGPLDQVFTWTAGIVMNMPEKAISWSSLDDQDLPNTGSVNFLKAPGSQPEHEKTLMEVRMSFSVPGAVLGELISDMFHYGDNLLNEALQDFKNHMEKPSFNSAAVKGSTISNP